MWHRYFRVGPRVDAEVAAEVGEKLARRSAHQQAQEYEQADALHAEVEEMGFEIDTRHKTWRVARTDRSGARRR